MARRSRDATRRVGRTSYETCSSCWRPRICGKHARRTQLTKVASPSSTPPHPIRPPWTVHPRPRPAPAPAIAFSNPLQLPKAKISPDPYSEAKKDVTGSPPCPLLRRSSPGPLPGLEVSQGRSWGLVLSPAGLETSGPFRIARSAVQGADWNRYVTLALPRSSLQTTHSSHWLTSHIGP